MKKNIVLAVIATAAMALSLVGCGVKVTNISVRMCTDEEHAANLC